MEKEVVAAWVAVVGVVISGVVSWLVARLTARTELRKQQLQLFQSYAEGLQARRLSTYPEAYGLISDSLKQLQRGTLTHEHLSNMLTRFQSWDSVHSLLLSNETAEVIFDAQWYVHNLLARGPAALTPEARHEIGSKFERMELALKEDIGVFAVEYEDKRKVRFYGKDPSEIRKRRAGQVV
jgi:hypothetical protein